MKSLVNRYTWIVFSVAMLVGSPAQTSAAPGVIADSPLFLASAVQPNIFFMVDDSGSMNWERTLNDGTSNPGGCTDCTTRGNGVLDFTPDSGTEMQRLCRGYNVMAYDPSQTYSPWAGVDEDGAAYTDKTLTTALYNPYDNDDIDNLSNHFYFTWTDQAPGATGNGVYSSGECASNFDPVEVDGDGDFVITKSDCVSAAGVAAGCVALDTAGVSAAEKTNYANWYTYYRKREYVVKKALSEIIDRSTSRVGLGTINGNTTNGFAAQQIGDVDDITTPINTAAQTRKNTLMNELFQIYSNSGTPLRNALKSVGEYYREGNDGLFSSSPILPAGSGGECQQNFAVLMSDGFWNGGSPGVGNADNDDSSDFDGGVYADSQSNTLADVAMRYYEDDLVSDATLADQVPTIQGVDTNNAQHMVTYTVAFGVRGGLTCNPTDASCAENWPTITADTSSTIDDLLHAAENGRGEFLGAADPSSLISSLAGIIGDIQNREGTAAAVSFNSTTVQSGSKVFQAFFNSEGWHGNLRAFDLDASGVGTAAWEAASILDARNLTSSPRKIATFNGSKGVPFSWPSGVVPANDLSASQVSDLTTNAASRASGTTVADYGGAIVDYLRGDFSNEVPNGQQFRDRNGHRLGDIVQSSPIFVGVPDTLYPDAMEGASNLYSTFQTEQASRLGRVYVGANDGMLHVFDSDDDGVVADGSEVFAYIPGLLFSSDSGAGLHALAEPSYTHNYYVDLSPTVADVFIGDAVSGEWRTILVGGLRGGGKGIFALDITDPSKLTEDVNDLSDVVLWEYTDSNLGFTFSEIRIGRMHNGKWAAIFGNGYNNDPGGDGEARLYIRYLDGSGTVTLATGAGSINSVGPLGDCSDAASDCNGMSTPALADLNGDAIIDRIYAGDLQGNMWVFDVRDSDSNNWGIAYQDSASNSVPLFQACTSTPCTSGGKAINRQPITTQPSLGRHPSRNANGTSPNIMVYFGTGQYLTLTDNTSAGPQSFYGVWDGGARVVTPSPVPLERSDLVAQTISETATQRSISDNAVNYDTGASPTIEYGWRIDLPASKERVVVEPVVIGDIVFFNTLIPSTTTCSGGGDGFLMTVDRVNGGLPDFAVFDVDNDGDFEANEIIAGVKVEGVPAASRFIAKGDGKLLRIVPDSGGNLNAGTVDPRKDDYSTRTSWTHLVD